MRWLEPVPWNAGPVIVPLLNSVVPVPLVPLKTCMLNRPEGAKVIEAESALTSAAAPSTLIVPRWSITGATIAT